MKICYITTVPFVMKHHLRNQIEATIEVGHEVWLATSPIGQDFLNALKYKLRLKPVTIKRKISLFYDICALINLYVFFVKERFDIIHSVTPKAGVLCAIAGFTARVPVRLHTFTGQVWMNSHGLMRWILKSCDWLVIRLNTQCYADSRSQRKYMADQGICRASMVKVLGSGSLGGVDLKRFNVNRLAKDIPQTLSELSLPSNARIITFVGRITRDKGIVELITAFNEVCKQIDNVFLILVGEIEQPLSENIIRMLTQTHCLQTVRKIKFVDYHPSPEKYLAISHLLCLPSYREGFPNVVLEAAALGVPTVGSDVIGIKDAVVDGVTGLLVRSRDSEDLAYAIECLLRNEVRRFRMGLAAKERAQNLFNARYVTSLTLQEYDDLVRR